MYDWYKKTSAIILILVLLLNDVVAFVASSIPNAHFGSTVFAQSLEDLQGDTFCGIDHNLDGDYDGEGEIARCDNGVCPITAQACLTNRVQQVCDEDTTEISCAPDEVIETCEPDTTTRQCDPDIVNEVCEPDTQVQVCEPDTTVRQCDPDTTRTVCDPDTTRTVCDPDTQRRVCEPDTQRQVCSTTRVCDPSTTRTVCTPQPDRQVCSQGYYEQQCTTQTTSVCPIGNRPCYDGRCRTRQRWRGGYRYIYHTCSTSTSQNCTNVWVPGECHYESQPDVCTTETVPGSCRDEQSCHWETVSGSCYWETVPGQCRTETVPGQCRTETVPGQCRNVTVPGACHWETRPGACHTEVTPGECRDVVIPGECTTQTIPGECNEITIPGECRNEPLPDECPLEGVDECRIGSDGISRCSDTLCVNTADFPIEDVSSERLTYQNDGVVDASGECLNDVQVFAGQGNDCRTAGLLTLFKNCCNNTSGEIMTDSGSMAGLMTTVTVVTTVFQGAKAAFTAFKAGATAAEAANVGMAAMMNISPVTLGITVALLFIDFLNLGCDAEDMETGLLRNSGMCHEIGTYCVAKIPFIGCIQKAKSHCCFNSKLGRIIHEQGRPQLKAFDGWGEPKDPICRGFTPAEFQALNFTDIDLSEYYGELATRSEGQLQSIFQDGLENFIEAGSVPND